MESLESLRKQLDSLDELRDIVKTMKALSATSIRQYERAVAALAEYYRTVERGLHVVLKDTDMPIFPALSARAPRRLGAVVFGSDHGLCGRFNEALAEYAIERMAASPAEREGRRILAVGARIAASLEHAGQAIEEDFLVPGSAYQITATVQTILLKIDEWLDGGDVRYVYLFFNRRSSGGGTHALGFELLPLHLQRLDRLEEGRWPSRSLPVFTMDRSTLLSRLLHQYLFVTIFRACAESQASEHASRLAAMQVAERNLENRIAEVTTGFRRARQSAITAELLDVVSGFEAIMAEQGRVSATDGSGH